MYQYIDGTVYEGEYKDDKRHGTGILRDAEGAIVYSGTWKNGNPVNKGGGGGGGCCVIS